MNNYSDPPNHADDLWSAGDWNGKPIGTPITYREFCERFGSCTMDAICVGNWHRITSVAEQQRFLETSG